MMLNPYNPGISMHKGYAFVQFTNPFDARSACMGEDGRNVFGQILDVNLVAEPKIHQIGRKRPNAPKAGAADWEQFYDNYNSGAAIAAAPPNSYGSRLTPPLKRPRMIVPTARSQQRSQSPKKIILPGIDDLRTYSSPDILICGNCRELFSSLNEFLDHRRQYCKLRFTCKCSGNTGSQKSLESASLLCALCKECFASAWDLMVHAQAAHMVNIYQLSNKDGTGESASGSLAVDGSENMSTDEDISDLNNAQELHNQPSSSYCDKEKKVNGLLETDVMEGLNGQLSDSASEIKND